MPRNFILIVGLSLAIIAALWFIDSPPPQLQPTVQADPDALTLVQYSDQLNTIQYDSSGLPEHKFVSSRVEHRQLLNDNDDETGTASAFFSQPHIVFFEEGKANWEITADIGHSELSDQGQDESIYLQQNVFINQTTQDPAQIESDSLWVNVANKHAYTDAPVKLSSPGAVSTGRGLDASVDEKTIKILANTKTRYEKRP